MKASRRKSTLNYFKNKCFVCGYKYFLDIHHLKHKKDGGDDYIENCVVLCANHHKEWHYIENTYYRYTHKANFERLNNGRDDAALSMDCIKFAIDFFENGIAPFMTMIDRYDII